MDDASERLFCVVCVTYAAQVSNGRTLWVGQLIILLLLLPLLMKILISILEYILNIRKFRCRLIYNDKLYHVAEKKIIDILV